MRHRSVDRTAELKLVAWALSRHHHRTTKHVVDVEQWLAAHENRRISGVLLVVWDRTDAAVIEHERPEAQVRVAASLVGWARRRAHDAGHADEIPGPAATDET